MIAQRSPRVFLFDIGVEAVKQVTVVVMADSFHQSRRLLHRVQGIAFETIERLDSDGQAAANCVFGEDAACIYETFPLRLSRSGSAELCKRLGQWSTQNLGTERIGAIRYKFQVIQTCLSKGFII